MAKGNQKIIESRAALELFSREQIIGPGAFNKRYFLLKDWPVNEFFGKKIFDCVAMENVSEVISEVPAYQYSSAILFPKVIESDEDLDDTDETFEDQEEDFDESVNRKADDENFRDEHVENTSSKNQNYPNTCGLSFCLSNKTKISDDLRITLQYRTYRRIKSDECRERRLGYWVPENQDEIARLVATHLSHVFATEILDENLFVYVKEGIDVTEVLHDIDYKYLEEVRTAELVNRITAIFPGQELFKKSRKKFRDVDTEYTSIYEDTLNVAIRDRITDSQSCDVCSELIHWLEIYNQLRAAVTGLKTIYRKPSARSKPMPIYQSAFLTEDLVFPELSTERVTRGQVILKNEPDLWIYYQYMKSKENDSVYVKLVVVNKHSITLKQNDPPQLNKKHEANEKSFFGVQLSITERIVKRLIPYNAPNLLSFDEEQSFAKLIYRQYEDFAEGHNASVTWGKDINQMRYVSTEFMPSQDVPKVNYRPSKLQDDGTVISRIDEEVLDFRRHSTLSYADDGVLLAELVKFIREYGNWIQEKTNELANAVVEPEGRDILERQLKSCAFDKDRMERNISLLRNDDDAMTAYRVMNTAMFMQLHHGNQIRENKPQPFIPAANDPRFYQQVKADYKWRSFQLAFILLNIDGFVRPDPESKIVYDVFDTGWPERNELADLVWFPTGGGKTEAYLGLIAFCIAYRRFTKGTSANGTTVLMRYTLRLLTLQQFQRATLLICALEVMRKEKFPLPNASSLGSHRITIGLFVGRDSAPNRWGNEGDTRSMSHVLANIRDQLNEGKEVTTKLPHTECPWCGTALFFDGLLDNVYPKPEDPYLTKDNLRITCHTKGCAFHHVTPLQPDKTLPLCLFDEDIYKFPPTLLFGTVDKFAALANRVSTHTSNKNADSRRLFGKGTGSTIENLPPELIIQDELHLLLGPLGSAVGLFEKSIDSLCSYAGADGKMVRPKIITSTATTRNTDKQIFALFERRSEIFPKQGINCDDSFFSFYERDENNSAEFESDRRYIGLLPSGKTQVWMQLRIASIAMTHRLRYMLQNFTLAQLVSNAPSTEFKEAFDYYHTILSYFNSLKEVGKTQSQLGHYLPGDINLITGNVLPWNFVDRMIRKTDEIDWGELTGRLTGERVKTSMMRIEKSWRFLEQTAPPEFVIATNMISVGIDISRLNVMIINSMPRNTAEYIQASSRVARKEKGLVFTVHHPFRSRDISHYQRFREFHEKFYGYVEPISVTPFASKALDRYLAMYIAVVARHFVQSLANNDEAINIDQAKADMLKVRIEAEITRVKRNAERLNDYLRTRLMGQKSNLEGIIGEEEFVDFLKKTDHLLFEQWLNRRDNLEDDSEFLYRHEDLSEISLFSPIKTLAADNNWNVKVSLREIAPSIIIKTVQQ